MLILVYIFLSAFLETETGGRITSSDLIMLILISISTCIAFKRYKLHFPDLYKSFIPLIVVFLISGLFSIYPNKSFFELFIIIFCYVGSIAMLNILINNDSNTLKLFFTGYIVVIGVMSTICVVDFLWIHGLISSRQLGGLQGPFRNTGQAGSFFGVHLILILSLIISRVVNKNFILILFTFITFLALLFTLKRASLIGFFVGLFLYIIFSLFDKEKENKFQGIKIIFIFCFVISLIGLIFELALGSVGGMLWRFENKFNSDIIGDFSEGFGAENVKATISAILSNPFVGVGLDNVRGIYMSHEIHSTYLGILAYGGLFGFMSYLFFIVILFTSIRKEFPFRFNSKWAKFLHVLYPFLIGLMISWAYTIHTRKREFWILISFVSIAIYLSRKMRKSICYKLSLFKQ